MKSINKNLLKNIALVLFIFLFAGVNIVYARTTSKVPFCDYGGVRRTFKIIGIIINLIKIVIPIIISYIGFATFLKIVMSGKTEDLKSGVLQLCKNLVAGLIIFFIPGVLDFTFDTLVGYDDSGFTTCTNCLLDTEHCEIPDTDPETYEEE